MTVSVCSLRHELRPKKQTSIAHPECSSSTVLDETTVWVITRINKLATRGRAVARVYYGTPSRDVKWPVVLQNVTWSSACVLWQSRDVTWPVVFST